MTDLEQFAAGERFAVDPDAIERELAEVWRAAGRSTEGSRPVTRACLWNVVVHLELSSGDEPDAAARDLEAMVAELPRHLAARALVLRTRPAHGEGPELKSWISANCILAPGGGKLVCSEEVSLESRGEGRRHLAPLVRALLVPGVPTAVVFGAIPDPKTPLAAALIELGDRVVLRCERCDHANAFGIAHELGPGRSLADLSWTAQADLRRAVAAVFDGAESEIERIERIEVCTGRNGRWSAALLCGWLAFCLDASAVLAREDEGVILHCRHAPVRFVLNEEGEERGVSARFTGPGVDRSVRREAAGDLWVDRPSGSRARASEPSTLAVLLSKALLRGAEDPSFRSALRWAEEIAAR